MILHASSVSTRNNRWFVTIFSSSSLLNLCCVVAIATGHETAVPNSNPMCYYLAGSRTSKLRKTSVRQVGQLWQFWEVSKQIALIDGFTTLSYLLDICNDIAESIKQFTLAFEANSRGKAACDILAMMAMAQTIAGLVISISSHFF